MGISLVLQQPLCIAWSAVIVEGQCKAFAQAAAQVDWTAFQRAKPPIAVIVDKPDAEQFRRMAQYEEALSSVPVDHEFIRPDADRAGYALVLDARQDSATALTPDALPAALLQSLPLRVSDGNHTSYALSQDRRWLVAYVRNAGHYELGMCDIQSVERYRLADRPRRVEVELRGFAGPCVHQVWDAATAKVVAQGKLSDPLKIGFDDTAADLLVLVKPE